MEKKYYSKPNIEKQTIDYQISLIMMSEGSPPEPPEGEGAAMQKVESNPASEDNSFEDNPFE